MKKLGLLVMLLGMPFCLVSSDAMDVLEQFYRNHTSMHDVIVHDQILRRGDKQFYYDAFYKIAHGVVAHFKRPTLLIDVMPEYGYCPFKLIKELQATAVLVVQDNENDPIVQSEILHHLSTAYGVDEKLMILNNPVDHLGLHYLSSCEHFDVALVANLFKVAGAQWKEFYAELCDIAEHVIMGIDNEGVTASTFAEACLLCVEHEGTLVKTIKCGSYEARFYRFFQRKNSIKACLLNDSKPHPAHVIESCFHRKVFIKDGIERPWYNGINLMTFRALHGVVPTEDHILDQLEALAPFAPKGVNTIIEGTRLIPLP